MLRTWVSLSDLYIQSMKQLVYVLSLEYFISVIKLDICFNSYLHNLKLYVSVDYIEMYNSEGSLKNSVALL